MNAVGTAYHMPPDKVDTLRRAKRIEWTSIIFMLSIILILGLTMGSSQTMKAMWLEDTLSLIPSVSFLIAAYLRTWSPNEQFPYGYRRAILIAFLCGSVALFGFGLYILIDSAVKLLTAEHATIQTIVIFGKRIWLGWLMMAALVYSVIPPLVLGRMKIPLAQELHDKALYTSATLNKGDWLSGIAGVLGLLGIAFGYWWADAVAALVISFEIVKDGFSNLRNSIAQLMNKRPSDVENKQKDPVIDKLQEKLEELDWVEKARVRLREDGDVLTGEVFIVPRNENNLLDRLKQATDLANSFDWRLHDINIVPVRDVKETQSPAARAGRYKLTA